MRYKEELLQKVCTSYLAKVACLKTFVFIRAQFTLRSHRFKKYDLIKVDKTFFRLIKDVLGTTVNAINDIIALPVRKGGLGIIPLKDDVDIAMVDYAFQLLSSENSMMGGIAFNSLCNTVRTRRVSSAKQEVTIYINSSKDGLGIAHES